MDNKKPIRKITIDLNNIEEQIKNNPMIDDLTKHKLIKAYKQMKKEELKAKLNGTYEQYLEKQRKEEEEALNKTYIVETIEVDGKQYRRVYIEEENGELKPLI